MNGDGQATGSDGNESSPLARGDLVNLEPGAALGSPHPPPGTHTSHDRSDLGLYGYRIRFPTVRSVRFDVTGRDGRRCISYIPGDYREVCQLTCNPAFHQRFCFSLVHVHI